MNASTVAEWSTWNQRYLVAALAEVRARLARDDAAADEARQEQERLSDELEEMPAIELVCRLFELSPFERGVLLLCVGTELDQGFIRELGVRGQPGPTFGTAMASIPDAHWSAATPDGPLRRWQLVHLTASGGPITETELHVDEQILHFVSGSPTRNPRLDGLIRPVPAGASAAGYEEVVERMVATWGEIGQTDLPVIVLHGGDATGKRSVARQACEQLGLQLSWLTADDIPTAVAERGLLARLWNRDALLAASALLIDVPPDGDGVRAAVRGLVRDVEGPLVIATSDRVPDLGRPALRLPVDRPDLERRAELWRRETGLEDAAIEAVATQFRLGPDEIAAAADVARRWATRDQRGLEAVLWDVCRSQARPQLDGLADLVAARTLTWDDLVLPADKKDLLEQIAAHVVHRRQVYDRWGFRERGGRGLGIGALFTGASGTGKTMAAEVLASELGLDLYRIDLSSVVSKYIGETEKNLRRVFDAAETGGAILLFDEADALFGKRSEVKDSRDRYANIEVGYLLQRMESYRGLAILTTNLRDNIDDAFLRRIRFAVRFPFPDAAQREAIWRRALPAALPTEGLDLAKLARLKVTGGSIRNIALLGAFLAARDGSALTMSHLLAAARADYAKRDEALSQAEIGGWG